MSYVSRIHNYFLLPVYFLNPKICTWTNYKIGRANYIQYTFTWIADLYKCDGQFVFFFRNSFSMSILMFSYTQWHVNEFKLYHANPGEIHILFPIDIIICYLEPYTGIVNDSQHKCINLQKYLSANSCAKKNSTLDWSQNLNSLFTDQGICTGIGSHSSKAEDSKYKCTCTWQSFVSYPVHWASTYVTHLSTLDGARKTSLCNEPRYHHQDLWCIGC